MCVIKIVSGLKEFSHRKSKIHTSPRYTATQSRWDSLCAMGGTGSQGWGAESMKDKTGREGLSSRVDVFMQRNKHEQRRSNSDILGVLKQ